MKLTFYLLDQPDRIDFNLDYNSVHASFKKYLFAIYI